MHLTIDTVADIGKGLSVKREKQKDNTERAIAHLKFTGLKLDRDQLDELVCRAIGWTTMCFYDELGAPFAHCVLAFPRLELEVSGVVKGPGRAGLRLAQATLTSVEVALADKCVLVSGELVWEAAGDEVSDIEALLGQTCGTVWTIRDDRRQDLLASVKSGRARVETDDGTGIDTITVLNTGRRRKTRDADANPEH